MNRNKKGTVKFLCCLIGAALLMCYMPSVFEKNIYADEVQEGLTIDLQSVSTSESSTAYIVAAFNNSYTELTRIANAGVLVNGNKLNYNSNYSQLSSVNSSDCIVTGNTIQFYTSSLSEGENTITFVNPDDNTKNVSVTLTMSKSGDYWSGYTYTVEVIPTGGKSHTSPKTAYEMWEAVGHGAIEENESYIITYKNEDKTYALGAENGVLTTKEISDPTATIDLADGYKWIPEKASSSGYWYLWNQEGSKNKFLSLTGETDYSSYPYKTTYTPSLASKQGYYDKTLYVDEDGSIWYDSGSSYSHTYNNIRINGDSMETTTDNEYMTIFTFYKHTTDAKLDISAANEEHNEKKAIVFTFAHDIPEKFTISETGILYTTNKLAGASDEIGNTTDLTKTTESIDIEAALKTEVKTKKYTSLFAENTGNISLTYIVDDKTDGYVYAAGYIKGTVNGSETTLYTDVAAVTYNSIVE